MSKIKSVFYNTNGEQYPELNGSWSRAKTQDEYIYLIFQSCPDKPMSRDDVEQICKNGNKNWPISSICRAINTLENSGLISKTHLSKKGQFGKKQYCYELKSKQWRLF